MSFHDELKPLLEHWEYYTLMPTRLTLRLRNPVRRMGEFIGESTVSGIVEEVKVTIQGADGTGPEPNVWSIVLTSEEGREYHVSISRVNDSVQFSQRRRKFFAYGKESRFAETVDWEVLTDDS